MFVVIIDVGLTWRITFLGSQLFKFWKENYNIYNTSNAFEWLFLFPRVLAIYLTFLLLFICLPLPSSDYAKHTYQHIRFYLEISLLVQAISLLLYSVWCFVGGRVRRNWAKERKNREQYQSRGHESFSASSRVKIFQSRFPLTMVLSLMFLGARIRKGRLICAQIELRKPN